MVRDLGVQYGVPGLNAGKFFQNFSCTFLTHGDRVSQPHNFQLFGFAL